MTKEEFLAQTEHAAALLQTLPVSAAILRCVAEELKKGDPPWWKRTAQAWDKRRFVVWNEAWGLFLTALHYEALNDSKNPLVPYLPSCGGTAEADPAPALLQFLSSPPQSFFDNLRVGHRRPYVEVRSKLWIPPAVLFFQKRSQSFYKKGLPFYLVEVNSGMGLNLAADLTLARRGLDWGLVQARIGLDPKPLDMAYVSHRRWATAAIFPEDAQEIRASDRAIDFFMAEERRDPNFVQLVVCPNEKAPQFVAKNIPAEKGMGLLVFNMAVTGRMTDTEYLAYARAMQETLGPWGDRALWLEIESVRGEMYSTTFQLIAQRVKDGQLCRHVMASFDFGANKIALDMELSRKFLAATPPSAS